MSDGRVARLGQPASVLAEELLTAVYGCPVVVDRHAVTGRPVVQVAWAPAPSRAGREGR
jgi:ABC-type hemin transport system ATPase subunit